MRRGWRRREALQALGALGAVPLLEAGAAAQAQAPRRLLVFYTPNAVIGPEWRPKGSETGFTLGRILAPLEPHRSKLLVLGGINMALADAGFGSHHTRGMGGLLTGRPILMGTFKSAGPPTAGWASGISVDQHIARTVGASTRFRSLELGVRVIDAEVRGRLSYLGASQPVPPMESPYDVFDRIFAGVAPQPGGGAPPPDPGLDRLRKERQSVLDFLKEELSFVRGRVSADDRSKLDTHTESLRDIERRLGVGTMSPPAPVAAGCQPPMVGARMDVAAVANMPAVGRLQMDLAAAAFACDLTRVITLQWTYAESDQTFPFIQVNGQHHAMSHASDTDAAAQENLTKIDVWYAEQMKYLLDKLSSYGESGKTVLDNSAVLWMSEVGKGNNHSHRDLPCVLAGSAAGVFRSGRFVDYMAGGAAGQPHNNLLLSLANAMGIKDATFGDPQHCTGPLPGLG
jgi:hypothetical protein